MEGKRGLVKALRYNFLHKTTCKRTASFERHTNQRGRHGRHVSRQSNTADAWIVNDVAGKSGREWQGVRPYTTNGWPRGALKGGKEPQRGP